MFSHNKLITLYPKRPVVKKKKPLENLSDQKFGKLLREKKKKPVLFNFRGMHDWSINIYNSQHLPHVSGKIFAEAMVAF